MAKQTTGLNDGPPGGASPNYKPTKDPNVVIGKHGAPITYDEFVKANKNGYAWKDFPAYADYVGGWARPTPAQTTPPPPYYRAYGQQTNIPSGDVAILQARYADDPKISQILQNNIAKEGEVPMFGVGDSDVIRQLIAKEKVAAQASQDPNYALAQAVNMAKMKGK